MTSIADSERVLGPEHPNTLASRNNLTNTCWGTEERGIAIEAIEAAVESRIKS